MLETVARIWTRAEHARSPHAPTMFTHGLLLAASALAQSFPTTGGNVCVIMLDDVAPGMIASFDAAAVAAGRPTVHPASTPAIDSLLAAQGMSFDRAWALPTCTPGRTAALTGRFGLRSGIGQIVPPRATRPSPGLGNEAELLPGLLRAATPSYASGAVGKWHLADQLQLVQNPVHPLGSGGNPWFDRFAGTWFNLGALAAQPYQEAGYYMWEKAYSTRVELAFNPCPAGEPPCVLDMNVNITPLDYPSVDTVEDALVLANELPEPWFLWVAPHATHVPAHPLPDGLPADPCRGTPAPGSSCSYPGVGLLQSQTRCMLEALDHQLGRLLCSLDFDDTTVILVADNGWSARALVPPYLVSRAKGSVYQGGVEVPFLVRSPAIPPALRGTRSDALVSVVDIFATVRELAGAPTAAHGEDSRSLLPILSGAQSQTRDILYTENFLPNFAPDALTGLPPAGYACSRHDQALRDSRFKLVRQWRRAANGAPPILTEQFFDLEQGAAGGPDWNETNNLIAPSAAALDYEAQNALGTLRSKLDTQYPKLVL